MEKRTADWLLNLNLLLSVSLIGFLIYVDTFDLIEKLELPQIEALSWGARIALLLIIAISLAGLIRELRFLRRRGDRTLSPRLAAHLVGPFLLGLFMIYNHAKNSGPITYAPPKNADYAYEDIKVPLPCGDVLAGSLTLPKKTGARIPAVVMITGSSPHDRDNASPQAPMTAYRPFRQIAHRLSSNGIAVLRMDDRGIGQSIGGDIRRLTTPERAKDIETCIVYLRQRPEIDASRIGLIGLSEGVSIAHMIASKDDLIKALVLLSGIGSPGKDVLRYQIQQGVLSENELSILLKQDVNTRFLYEFDPLITLRVIKQPVLIIHGDRDSYVPYTDAFQLGKAIQQNGNKDVTIRILTGYDHTLLKESADGKVLSARVPDEVLATILDWLARKI